MDAPRLSLVVALFAMGIATPAAAEHLDRDTLANRALTVEVEELAMEHDHRGIALEYEIDRRDHRQLRRNGLSLWMAVFTTPGTDAERLGPLWHAAPALSADGSHDFPHHLPLDGQHVYVRLVAISNGTVLSAGHGMYTNGAVMIGVEGNHDEDDHQHAGRRHVHDAVGHGPNLDESVEIDLAYAGSLHQYGWYAPTNGFDRFRRWFRHQQLWTTRFRRHLHHHHVDRRWHRCTERRSPTRRHHR